MSVTIKGNTLNNIVKKLNAITAKQLGTIARKAMRTLIMKDVSTKIAQCVSQSSVDPDTEKVYIQEKQLQYKNKVPGNLTDPKPISSNLLAGFLDVGTKAHNVSPVNSKALHFNRGQGHYFSRGHKVSGIKGKQFWNIENIEDPLHAFINERIKKAFSNG